MKHQVIALGSSSYFYVRFFVVIQELMVREWKREWRAKGNGKRENGREKEKKKNIND